MSVSALLTGLIAASLQSSTPVPPAALALLAALESGDAQTARAVLAPEATIADSSSGRGAEASLDALMIHARGCAHSELTWDYDSAAPANASVALIWTCPSRAPAQAFIWTQGARVVWVQFGLSMSPGNGVR